MKVYSMLYIGILFILVMGFASALTPDGSTPAGDNMNIFITTLFIVSTLGLFYIFLITLTKLAIGEVTVYDVIVSWASYILLIIVNHLTAHYVEDPFMYNLTETFIIVTTWSNGVFPIIAFVISLIIRSLQKKKNLSIQEISGVKLSHG